MAGKKFKSFLNIRKIRKLFMQIYSNCDIIIQTCLATETITSIIHKAYYEVINSHLCDSWWLFEDSCVKLLSVSEWKSEWERLEGCEMLFGDEEW